MPFSASPWNVRQIVERATGLGLSVSEDQIRRSCRTGEIRAEQVDGDWLIPDWQAQAWLQARLSEQEKSKA